jgi:Family of unknown function (DUF6088)
VCEGRAVAGSSRPGTSSTSLHAGRSTWHCHVWRRRRHIRRVGRGLYDYPRQHDKLGALSPNPTDIARALSTQSGDKLAPSGAAAANQLGISTQVPAKESYATTGRTRVKQAGGRSVTLKHSRAPVLDNASDNVNALVQAMAQLGRNKTNDDTIRRFAARRDDRDMQILNKARSQMPGWMCDAVLKMGAVRNG